MPAKCPKCGWKVPYLGPYRNTKKQPFNCPGCETLVRHNVGFPFMTSLVVTVPVAGSVLLYRAPDMVKLIAALCCVPLLFAIYAVERLDLEPQEPEQEGDSN